jgi:uncharacterized protein (DUF2147 family)
MEEKLKQYDGKEVKVWQTGGTFSGTLKVLKHNNKIRYEIINSQSILSIKLSSIKQMWTIDDKLSIEI